MYVQAALRRFCHCLRLDVYDMGAMIAVLRCFVASLSLLFLPCSRLGIVDDCDFSPFRKRERERDGCKRLQFVCSCARGTFSVCVSVCVFLLCAVCMCHI